MNTELDRLKREYASLYPYLYRYVAYRVPRREDAEDVVSDVFLSAVAKLGEFDPTQGSLKQWLTGFARFKVLAYWRARRPAIPLDELFEIPDPTFATKILGRLNRELEARHILRGLNAEAKALLAMRYEDDLTYQEIADALGQEACAVRQRFSRLHRALKIASSEPSL
ncbi:hypothetical protein A3C96_02120 [Candidatus Uhrbacteria bacterium RIFCSPHIGHO2_02_FULL_60_10]|uniref:RNA polymerase sigma-70 region 2 domain-containing protein n=1 Tax=Candidatus Uhrbacteria bacterium RIFCSPHIGHO2_02_FULL_60_10 TaxID=1802392 RepID=A0A1F7U8K8_9BACT|nr:MAG: hypothetical protein A3C96_02120 [Candidatus Uhrbacteria bacterium RIFCSPHIGHO2_02_FULL_60_10]